MPFSIFRLDFSLIHPYLTIYWELQNATFITLWPKQEEGSFVGYQHVQKSCLCWLEAYFCGKHLIYEKKYVKNFFFFRNFCTTSLRENENTATTCSHAHVWCVFWCKEHFVWSLYWGIPSSLRYSRTKEKSSWTLKRT